MSVGLVCLGVSHKTAPVALRERLAISLERQSEVLHRVGASPAEALFVSTCNRVELYRCGNFEEPAEQLRAELLALGGEEVLGHAYLHRGEAALLHLFRVASSLDSMVVGEPQILGQVKDAFEFAKGLGAARGELERVCAAAFSAAKRVRTGDRRGAGGHVHGRGGGTAGEQNLREPGGQDGTPRRCRRDVRACGSAPGRGRRPPAPGHQPHPGAGRGARPSAGAARRCSFEGLAQALSPDFDVTMATTAATWRRSSPGSWSPRPFSGPPPRPLFLVDSARPPRRRARGQCARATLPRLRRGRHSKRCWPRTTRAAGRRGRVWTETLVRRGRGPLRPPARGPVKASGAGPVQRAARRGHPPGGAGAGAGQPAHRRSREAGGEWW